jgi:hypothetical protein
MHPIEQRFHDPAALLRGFKILAMLDSVLEVNSEQRYHKFWPGRITGADVAMVENGAGDDMFCIFSDEHGSIIKGFDHNSPISPHDFATGPHDFRPWPGIYEETPTELLQYLEFEDFKKTDVTFCIWRRPQDKCWLQGDVDFDFPPDTDDGLSFLLGTVYLDAESYLDWARDYYGKHIPSEPVRTAYASCALSRSIAVAINPDVDLTKLERDLKAMGMSLS